METHPIQFHFFYITRVPLKRSNGVWYSSTPRDKTISFCLIKCVVLEHRDLTPVDQVDQLLVSWTKCCCLYVLHRFHHASYRMVLCHILEDGSRSYLTGWFYVASYRMVPGFNGESHLKSAQHGSDPYQKHTDSLALLIFSPINFFFATAWDRWRLCFTVMVTVWRGHIHVK